MDIRYEKLPKYCNSMQDGWLDIKIVKHGEVSCLPTCHYMIEQMLQ